MNRIARMTVILLGCIFLLGGCASKYGVQTTQVSHFPDCYEPIKRLRSSEQQYAKSTGGGALLGSLLGALVGYAATGKAEGAIAGAVGGAVVGGAAGYAQASSQETQDMAYYLSQLDGDISGLDTVTAAGRLSLQCYDKSFNRSLDEFKTRRISRAELDSRYREIHDGSEEALRIMRAQAGQASEKESRYQAALQEQAQAANRPVPAIASNAPQKRPAARPGKNRNPQKEPPAQASRPRQTRQNSGSQDSLTQMAEQTQTLSQSRAELQNGISEGSAMQSAWDKELRTLGS